MNAGGTQGNCVVTDPSTGNTATIIIHTPATWYIRTDGGTATQCTGHTNAAYTSGTGQPCGLIHPFYMLATGSGMAWRSDYYGGDTVQFNDSGPYYIGETDGTHGTDWTAVGIGTTACALTSGHAFNCVLPSLPSGTAAYPTKWYGKNVGACHTALTGTANPNRFNLDSPTIFSAVSAPFVELNIQGTSYPDIECMELTQPVTCATGADAAITIVGDSQSGTTGTFFWHNSGGQQPHYGSSFGGEYIDVAGTTNGSGALNFTHRQVLSGGTNTQLNITGSQSDGTNVTLTFSVVGTNSPLPANGDNVNIAQTLTNCGGNLMQNFNSQTISSVTGTTFVIAGDGTGTSCGFASESGSGSNNSSGSFTIGGFSSATIAYANESAGTEDISGKCGNAYTGNNYAGNGIILAYVTNPGPSSFTLKDIEIDGLGGAAMLGTYVNTATNGTSNMSYMKIIGNQGYGWNGDGGGCGNSCLSTGTLNVDHYVGDFNGCAEVLPNGGWNASNGLPVNGVNYCYFQGTGILADGLAQIAAGNFTMSVTNSEFLYNTKNGLDLLHLGDAGTGYFQTVSVKNNWSEGNLGQTFKVGGNNTASTIWDNVSISNCRSMSDEASPASNVFLSMNPLGWNAGVQSVYGYTCRAAGDQWEISFSPGNPISFIHNTTLGYGSTMYDLFGNVSSTTTFMFKNNISFGFTDPYTSTLAAGFYASYTGSDPLGNSGSSGTNNLAYSMRSGTCPLDATYETAPQCGDPMLLAESNINAINPNLTSGSATYVIGKGTTAGPTLDFFGTTFLSPPAIGSFETGSTPTASTPTSSLAPGTYVGAQTTTVATVTSGATICYTTDGTTPAAATAGTCSHGTSITGGSGTVSIPSTLTLQALATESGYLNSSVAPFAYTITQGSQMMNIQLIGPIQVYP